MRVFWQLKKQDGNGFLQDAGACDLLFVSEIQGGRFWVVSGDDVIAAMRFVFWGFKLGRECRWAWLKREQMTGAATVLNCLDGSVAASLILVCFYVDTVCSYAALISAACENGRIP